MTNDPNTPNGAADVLPEAVACIRTTQLIDFDECALWPAHCFDERNDTLLYTQAQLIACRDSAVAALIARNAELEAERGQSDKYAWTEGFPPYPHAEEWFLADTEFGPAVLRSLPKEHAYDYKTADETYIMKGKVKRWMQLPNSEFVAYESRGQIFELRAERDALIARTAAGEAGNG